MSQPEQPRTGARCLADIVSDWQLGPVFHVPGEGTLALLDTFGGLGLDLVSCRHEAGACFMAQAVGQVTGRPGVCVVARAPGALNTCLALHTAQTDAAPMIMIVGQASQGQAGREAFIGAEIEAVFAPICKWVGRVETAARLPEAMARAWRTAMSGRRGPVVLVVPEDVFAQESGSAGLPVPVALRHDIAEADVDGIANLIDTAERPLLVVGGTGWPHDGLARLGAAAAAAGLPVATAYRRRDLVSADHPGYVGELGIGAGPAALRAVAEADTILVAGMKLGEINTFGGTAFEGYSLLSPPRPAQRLIHIHPDPSELDRVYRCDLAICAEPAGVAHAVERLAPSGIWRGWRDGLRREHIAYVSTGTCPGPLDMRAFVDGLRRVLPEDAVLTVGAGAYALWPQRYFPHTQPGTQLGPKSGAMGYGLPAAVGVAAAVPGRRVVAMAGDGCFMMHGEELATAVLHALPVTVIVVNNASYGAIAASQQLAFGRHTGTTLAPVDFTAYARAMGVEAVRVTATAAIDAALERIAHATGPLLVELVTGPEALRPPRPPRRHEDNTR